RAFDAFVKINESIFGCDLFDVGQVFNLSGTRKLTG
ncbi:MAG: hypothetical protein JWM11_3886, partial [Planctomycetaceae bacterium]|nr:hypothetical protein [Planctomycetaceae bacterium]